MLWEWYWRGGLAIWVDKIKLLVDDDDGWNLNAYVDLVRCMRDSFKRKGWLGMLVWWGRGWGTGGNWRRVFGVGWVGVICQQLKILFHNSKNPTTIIIILIPLPDPPQLFPSITSPTPNHHNQLLISIPPVISPILSIWPTTTHHHSSSSPSMKADHFPIHSSTLSIRKSHQLKHLSNNITHSFQPIVIVINTTILVIRICLDMKLQIPGLKPNTNLFYSPSPFTAEIGTQSIIFIPWCTLGIREEMTMSGWILIVDKKRPFGPQLKRLEKCPRMIAYTMGKCQIWWRILVGWEWRWDMETIPLPTHSLKMILVLAPHLILINLSRFTGGNFWNDLIGRGNWSKRWNKYPNLLWTNTCRLEILPPHPSYSLCYPPPFGQLHPTLITVTFHSW